MTVNYRGFDIHITREKCMAGYSLLYYSVYRKSDGWEMICSYTEGSDTIRDYVKYMKEHVDEFILDPAEQEPQDEHETSEEFAKRILAHRTENEKTRIFHG